MLQKVFEAADQGTKIGGMIFLAKKDFEERVEETAKKASKVIEQPPDQMKPRAKETLNTFVKELEELYQYLVITEADVEGLVLEPREDVTLEEKHQETLKRISNILYDTYVKMGKEDAAEEWKKRAETIARPGSSED